MPLICTLASGSRAIGIYCTDSQPFFSLCFCRCCVEKWVVVVEKWVVVVERVGHGSVEKVCRGSVEKWMAVVGKARRVNIEKVC